MFLLRRAPDEAQPSGEHVRRITGTSGGSGRSLSTHDAVARTHRNTHLACRCRRHFWAKRVFGRARAQCHALARLLRSQLVASCAQGRER